MAALSSLAASALFILLTCTLAAAARALIALFLRKGFLRSLADDALAAAELCGCSFELSIVADNFGVRTYVAFLFVLTMWWSASWGSASACPYPYLEDLVTGHTDLLTATLKTWAELAGGILVFRYVQLYWRLEIVDSHVGRAFTECSADLMVPMMSGAVIEGVGTFAMRVASKALNGTHFARIANALLGTALITAAFDSTGGFFCPVLATSRKFGCRRATRLEHIVVYWVGPCLGSVASVLVVSGQGTFPHERTW